MLDLVEHAAGLVGNARGVAGDAPKETFVVGVAHGALGRRGRAIRLTVDALGIGHRGDVAELVVGLREIEGEGVAAEVVAGLLRRRPTVAAFVAEALGNDRVERTGVDGGYGRDDVDPVVPLGEDELALTAIRAVVRLGVIKLFERSRG